jgi:DNA-binding NarL/FixJ family response regulator
MGVIGPRSAERRALARASWGRSSTSKPHIVIYHSLFGATAQYALDGLRRYPAAGMKHSRKKVLCIEDDRESAAQIATSLADRGFEISVAHDGQDGLLAILKDKPDLVLCEVGVLKMSGFELLKRLDDIAPRLGRIPFIFLTASSDRKNELKGRQLDADDHITKPIDYDRLTLIIEARLAGVARNKAWSKQVHLNDREIEMLTWVARGETSHQIARKLQMSKRTVDFHIDNARVKLGAQTRAAAAIKAAIGGLIEP